MKKCIYTPLIEALSLLSEICPNCDKYVNGQLICNKSTKKERKEKGCFLPQIVLKYIMLKVIKTK